MHIIFIHEDDTLAWNTTRYKLGFRPLITLQPTSLMGHTLINTSIKKIKKTTRKCMD